MKAYTVYQPYAYATVAGIKRYETRPRRTNIRGRVAVHAGKEELKRATKGLSDNAFWSLMEAVGGKTVLPLGAVVGTVEIVDCVPVEEIADTLTNEMPTGRAKLSQSKEMINCIAAITIPPRAPNRHQMKSSFVGGSPVMPANLPEIRNSTPIQSSVSRMIFPADNNFARNSSFLEIGRVKSFVKL